MGGQTDRQTTPPAIGGGVPLWSFAPSAPPAVLCMTPPPPAFPSQTSTSAARPQISAAPGLCVSTLKGATGVSAGPATSPPTGTRPCAKVGPATGDMEGEPRGAGQGLGLHRLRSCPRGQRAGNWSGLVHQPLCPPWTGSLWVSALAGEGSASRPSPPPSPACPSTGVFPVVSEPRPPACPCLALGAEQGPGRGGGGQGCQGPGVSSLGLPTV